MQWEPNKLNSRGLNVFSKESLSPGDYDLIVGQLGPALNDENSCRQSVTYPCFLSEGEKLYFKLYQNSGSTLKYNYRIRIIAFKNL